MTKSTKQEKRTTHVTALGTAKAARKAIVAKRAPRSASANAKVAQKAGPAKKTPESAKKASSAPRGGSKTAHVLDLLKRPGGATAKELMEITGWQPHSVRGFLSGTVRTKMGLPVTSSKGEGRERTYSVTA